MTSPMDPDDPSLFDFSQWVLTQMQRHVAAISAAPGDYDPTESERLARLGAAYDLVHEYRKEIAS